MLCRTMFGEYILDSAVVAN